MLPALTLTKDYQIFIIHNLVTYKANDNFFTNIYLVCNYRAYYSLLRYETLNILNMAQSREKTEKKTIMLKVPVSHFPEKIIVSQLWYSP